MAYLLAGQTQQSLLQNLPTDCKLSAVAIPSAQSDPAATQMLELCSDDKKLIQAFAFLITHNKKSTPRLQAMEALYLREAHEDLAEMILAYCLQWEPTESVWERALHFLSQHPESLGLRLPLALLACSQQQPERIAHLLDQRLDWFDFVEQYPQLSGSVQAIRIYHTMTCLYFALTFAIRPAVWAWLICAESGASLPERQTLSREIVRRCQQADQLKLLKSWLQTV